MIEGNDIFLIEELRRCGLNKRSILKFLRNLGGMRIYVRKKKSEYEEIKELYSQLITQGIKRNDAIKRLADLYEKSENRIRAITRYQGSLFEF